MIKNGQINENLVEGRGGVTCDMIMWPQALSDVEEWKGKSIP